MVKRVVNRYWSWAGPLLVAVLVAGGVLLVTSRDAPAGGSGSSFDGTHLNCALGASTVSATVGTTAKTPPGLPNLAHCKPTPKAAKAKVRRASAAPPPPSGAAPAAAPKASPAAASQATPAPAPPPTPQAQAAPPAPGVSAPLALPAQPSRRAGGSRRSRPSTTKVMLALMAGGIVGLALGGAARAVGRVGRSR